MRTARLRAVSDAPADASGDLGEPEADPDEIDDDTAGAALTVVPDQEVADEQLYAELVDPDGDDGSEETSGVADEGPQTIDAPQLVDAVPYAVDPPAGHLTMRDLTGVDFAGRQAVLPRWMKSRADARFVARFVALWSLHQLTFHATRTPKYLAKLAARLVVGAARAWLAWLEWVLDLESRPLRRTAVTKGDATMYANLARLRSQNIHRRLLITAAWIAGGAVTLGVGWWLAPWWAWAAGSAAGGVALVRRGAPQDAPLFDVAVVSSGRPIRLTSRMVNDALGSLGLKGINDALKSGRMSVEFTAPITRDGPGWRADVQLPRGVTVADVMERREQLASGLRRPLGCVWPEPVGEDNPGRLVLWVGDQDLSKTPQPAWPLLRAGAADLFRDIPFGTDQRGRPVAVGLMFASVLIGAMPRFGKTFALRLILLACALDTRVELRTWELKGTGDLGPLEPVCHRYGSGADEETIDAAIADLEDVHRELDRRARRIKSLPRELVPENKVTPDVASVRRYGLHPLVLAVDECQELFTYGDNEQQKRTAKLAEAILKRGPAMGVIAIFATQRPDARSVPTGVSSNALVRFCLKVMGQVENDMVLGTSKYKAGIRATMFGKRDKGIGWLDGHAEDPQITRSYYVDGPQAEKVVARALAARRAAGTVTGAAAGETPEAQRDLVDDVRTIFVTAERMHSADIVEALQQLDPSRYAGLDPASFAKQLKGLTGVETRQMEIGGRNRWGLRAEDVQAALAARDERRELPPGEGV